MTREQRTIKFRAWDRAGKVMVDWLTMTQTAFNRVGEVDQFGLLYRVFTKRPEMDLMQFTGLKDKNGKEIYEGDIIKSPSHVPEIMQIEFIEGGFCATGPSFWPIDMPHFYPSVGTDLEVIGNIYENPHLLSPNPEKEV